MQILYILRKFYEKLGIVADGSISKFIREGLANKDLIQPSIVLLYAFIHNAKIDLVEEMFCLGEQVLDALTLLFEQDNMTVFSESVEVLIEIAQTNPNFFTKVLEELTQKVILFRNKLKMNFSSNIKTKLFSLLITCLEHEYQKGHFVPGKIVFFEY